MLLDRDFPPPPKSFSLSLPYTRKEWSRYQFLVKRLSHNALCGRSSVLFWRQARGILCMWKTGTLSYEEFENDLLDFLERARKVGDPWNLQISKVQSWKYSRIVWLMWAGNNKLLFSSSLWFLYILLFCTRNGWTVCANYACPVLSINFALYNCTPLPCSP